MQMTDTHFIISVPRFAGYKTLFVNAVIILFGVVTVVYPTFVSPDPGTVGAFYDTATGFVAMIIGLINVVLRLITSTPSAPFKPVADASPPIAKTLGFVGTAELEAALRSPVVQMRSGRDLVRMDNVRPVPVFDAVETMRTDNISVRDAIALDAVALEIHERTGIADVVRITEAPPRSGLSALRAFAIALVLPSLMLASFAGVASLGGCAVAKEVNAVVSAESVEQRAFALYGTFTVLEERAAELVQDRRIPKAARLNIQRVDRAAKPLADRVRALAVNLNAARLAFSTAQGGAAKVAAAVEALQAALVAFQPALSAMTTAVNTARA